MERVTTSKSVRLERDEKHTVFGDRERNTVAVGVGERGWKWGCQSKSGKGTNRAKTIQMLIHIERRSRIGMRQAEMTAKGTWLRTEKCLTTPFHKQCKSRDACQSHKITYAISPSVFRCDIQENGYMYRCGCGNIVNNIAY